jgi:hypothetical protein
LFFFAWVDKGTAFDPDVHSVEDEIIYSVDISQSEGDYATLTLEIENPGVGLLSPGRKQWAWFSEDGTPRFYGRLDAAPDDTTAETIQVELIAEPDDIQAQKEALAATLRTLPNFDRAWIQQDVENPDTALEAYTVHYDVDPITHELSVVDIINPGGSDIEILESQHFYDAFRQTKRGVPLKKWTLKATAKWRQKATGTVDLSRKLWEAFNTTGASFPFPNIASLSSAGLVDDWPEPLKNLNGGWSMAVDSYAILSEFMQSGFFPITYIDKSATEQTADASAPGTSGGFTAFGSVNTGVGFNQTQYGNPLLSPTDLFNVDWKEWQVSFPIIPVNMRFTVSFEADRERTEILTLSLTADTQSLYFDAGSEEEELIELSSEFIDQPVDDGEALPIVDLRRNNYFPTDRGQLSLQYFLLLGRARLVWRARAIEIEFETEWDTIADIINCRRRFLLHDHRLAGGQALGKVVGYSLIADDTQKIGRVTIACAIGYGIALPAANNDGDTYAEDYADDYTELINLTIDVVTGELQYSGFDGSIVIDDDGVDFFNMTPDNILLEPITITNGLFDQQALIEAATDPGITDPDPIGAWRDAPTRPRVKLKPVAGGAFLTEYQVTTSNLVIPKMIDLEAA